MTTKDNEPKPVAWIEHGSDEVPSIVVWERGAVGHYTPLYEHPSASKPWVGLTEQEHTDIAIQCGCMSADWVFYGATVERILKEKNS